MGDILMKCGCVSNAVLSARGVVKIDPPIPVCAIHDCTEVADTIPDLTGRTARCTCGKKLPSSFDLPFFEYRGPGSRNATESCICGYYRAVHERRAGAPAKHRYSEPGMRKCGGTFTPRGDMPDLYYCGHGGWD